LFLELWHATPRATLLAPEFVGRTALAAHSSAWLVDFVAAHVFIFDFETAIELL